MAKVANYIKRIRIHGLWGRVQINWELRPDVNILSGINGIGKTTIINQVVDRLSGKEQAPREHLIDIEFDRPQADSIRFDVIRSFDRPLLRSEFLDKLSDKNVKTELDWQLYQLQRSYLDYQVNIGNRMIEILSSPEEDTQELAKEVAAPKKQFQQMIDLLFGDTGKVIDRKSNEIRFMQADEVLLPYQLSSGEKQMLVILLTVLVQDKQPGVLFMDEPEISLHIEWQQKLISLIRELNPNVQIILTTHSPAVIMEGWLDAVTEVSDVSTPADF
ncbi:MAG: ATP-binding protein [Bacteroides sp.]|nr:ATP-binding protein [Bacteroides sp.]